MTLEGRVIIGFIDSLLVPQTARDECKVITQSQQWPRVLRCQSVPLIAIAMLLPR
jgi:hypothetical protein